MSEPIYLYSYGRRRHIKDPNAASGRRPEFSARSLCGDWHDTEERMLDTFRWWDPALAESRMARKKAEPICQRCQKAWDKQVAS